MSLDNEEQEIPAETIMGKMVRVYNAQKGYVACYSECFLFLSKSGPFPTDLTSLFLPVLSVYLKILTEVRLCENHGGEALQYTQFD